jgi:uncharacterized protein DUF4956
MNFAVSYGTLAVTEQDFLKRIGEDVTNIITPERTLNFWQVVITLVMSFVLGLIITKTYSKTHKGTTYSQSFCHTIIIMCMVIAIIMIVIGSNIARAFSLVGALSIIRFRTAVKDARDTGFVFFGMAAGMACGTKFFLTGITMTLTICFLILLLTKWDYGAKPNVDKLLTLRLPNHISYQEHFTDHFLKYLSHFALTTVDLVQMGSMTELTYNVRFKAGQDEKEFLDGIRTLNDNNKVTLIYRDQRVDI